MTLRPAAARATSRGATPPNTRAHRVGAALGRWLPPAFALAYAAGWLEDRLPLRWQLGGALLLGAAGTYRWRAAFRGDRRRALAVLALFAASCALPVLRAWGDVALGSPVRANVAYVTAGLLTTVVLGWAAVLHLAAEGAVRHPGTTAPAWAARPAALALAGASLVTLVACSGLSRRWFQIDEVLYVLQGRLFSEFQYAWRWGALPDRFFKLIYTVPVADGQFSQYTPGYPAILAVATWLGIRNYLNPLLGSVTVLVTYLIGRRVHSPLAGLAASALLATQAWFVEFGANYFSHTAGMCVLAVAAWLLVRAATAAGRARVAHWYLAGLLLGTAVTIRPLTGVLAGLSVWLWMLLRRRLTRTESLAMSATVAAGGILPVLCLLYYNHATTGGALRFGYDAALGKLAALGFGERGYITFDERVRPVRETFLFTPVLAAWGFIYAAWDMCRAVLPPSSILPLVGVAILSRVPFRRAAVAAFLLLPVVHYFYFSNGPRFYLELLPFLFVAVGAVVAHLWRRDRAAGRAVLAYLVVANAFLGGRRLREWYAGARDGFSRSGFAYMERIRAAQREHGRILLFVRNPARSEPLFVPLSWFNATVFPGDVIVARDLGAENAVLVRRFPDHVPMLVTWPTGRERARLVPLPPAPPDSVAADSTALRRPS